MRDNILSAVKNAAKTVVSTAASIKNTAHGKTTITPTITMPSMPKAPTARQRMLVQEEEDEDRWYKDNNPTTGEILARIYTISKKDPTRGEELFNAYSSFSNDPSSPIYNPYFKATNNAVSELSKMGFDMSKGATQDWIKANSNLMNSYRTGASGTPLAPSSKSTTENDAAYWYYQIVADEERTQKAENEWEALQEEITYWTQRKDRNYSDQEILDRIDWSNYSTLTSMDEAKKKGVPLSLNRAIGYSQDALAGVIWAARNGGSSGNAMIDSVKAALGDGVSWKEDSEISAMLDPASDRYNPYAVGSTIDDAALYFGLDGFDSAWLDQNRGYLGSRDKTAKKYYGKVYDAEQNTLKAEAEIEELWKRIEYEMQYSNDPEYILDGVLEGRYTDEAALNTLIKMDESLKSGDLMATTRAIDYRWEDVEAEVRRRCAARNSAPKADAYVQDVAGTLGMNVPSVSSNDAINADKDLAIKAAGGNIAKDGTDEEKIVWKSAYSSNYETYVQQINESITNGITDAQGGYDYTLNRANGYAAKNYMSALETIIPYKQAQKDLADAVSARAAIEADVKTSEAEKNEALAQIDAYIKHQEIVLENLAPKQEKANKTMSLVTDGYDIAVRLAQMTGADVGEPQRVLDTLDYAYQFSEEYVPDWHAYNLYDAALAEGKSYEETAAAARKGKENNQKKIDEINAVLQTISEQNMVLDRKYITNMERYIVALESSNREADYFLMNENADFDSVVAEERQKINKAWGGWDRFLPTFIPRDGYNFLDASAANPAVGVGSNFMPSMTKEEQDRYLYIRAKEGAEAAEAYYEFMANANDGVLQMRTSRGAEQFWKDFSAEHEVAGSVLSVIAFPLQVAGTAYGATQSVRELLGDSDSKVNPYAGAFGATRMIGTTRDTVKQEITSALGKNSIPALVATVGYDALMSTGDNLMAAASLGSLLGNAAMGASAASGSFQSSAEKGANATQSLLGAGVNAIIESVTESHQFEAISGKLLGKITKENAPSFLKHMIDSIGIEFFGEGASELGGQVSDALIMGELSDWNASVEAYRMEGMNKKDATKAAALDALKNILYAAAVGGVSGGMSGAFTYSGSTQSQITDEQPTDEQAVTDEDDQFPIKAQEEAPPVEQQEADAENAANEKTARTIAALTQALETEDVASRTATIAAVISPQDQNANKQMVINAAAQHLSDRFGSENAVDGIRKIVLTTAEKSIRQDKVNEAIAIAALSEGEASQALEAVMQNPTEENVINLLDAAERDAGNPSVVSSVQKKALENKIAMREKQLVADGALSGVSSYETAVSQAQANVQAAQNRLDTAKREQAAASQNLQMVNSEFIADPNNQMLRGATQQAIKDVEGKAIMTAQAEQGLDSAQSKLTETQKTLESVRANTMKQVREQAQQDVLAEMQAQEEAEKQAIEAAKIQAYDEAVAQYKPASPAGKLVSAKLEDGTEVSLIGAHSVVNGPDGYMLYMDDEGNVHSEETLTIDDTDFIKKTILDDTFFANAKAVTKPDVNFQHGVPVFSNNTGAVSYAIGLVANENGSEHPNLMLANGNVVKIGSQYSAVDPQALDDAIEAAKITNPDVFYPTSTEQQPDENQTDQKPKKEKKPEPELQLESWQDPQYHGKVKKPRKLNTKTKNFKKWFNDPTGGLLSNPDGSPKVIYRGTNSKLYMEHKAGGKYDAKKINNFYSPDIEIAKSYASGSSHVFTLYDIVNWETAEAAMAAEGYKLKKVQENGVWGYRPVGIAPETQLHQGDFYRENEIERFNKEYGKITRNGLYAGYISVKKPLVLDGNNKHYSKTHGTAIDKNGQPFTATMKNREWGEWARANGYDCCIVTNSYDYLYGVSSTLPSGTVIMTFGSEKFKSIYNTGKLGKKEADIRYNKKVEAGKFKLTGEPVSKQMENVLDKLAAGQQVTEEELKAIPEVKWANEHQIRDESGNKRTSLEDYKDDPERAEDRKEIALDLMEMGSAVIDSEGKATYTGPVKQNKRLDIVMGTPASGKSSALANYVSRMFGSRILDSDMVKERLDGYNDGLTSDYVHMESREVWKSMQDQAIANGDNTVLPIVGASMKSILKDIKKFRDAGYTVNVHYVQLADTKTIGRAMNRFIEDGRYIEPEYLTWATGDKISENYETLKEEGLIDGYSKWDNDVKRGEHPILLESENAGFEEESGLGNLFGGRGDRGGVGGGSQTHSESPGQVYGEPSGTFTGSGVDYSLSVPADASFIGSNGKKVGKIKSAYRIINELSKATGIPVDARTKTFLRNARKKASGYRQRGRNIVHVRDASDIQTVAHEFGHIFDEALGHKSQAPTQKMIDYLQNHPNPKVRAWINLYDPKTQHREVVAEFAKYWLLDRNRAIAFGGKAFTEFWEKTLDERGWLKPMQQAAQDFRLYSDASALDQIKSSIDLEDTRDAEEGSWFARLRKGMSDYTLPFDVITQAMRKHLGDRYDASKDVRVLKLAQPSIIDNIVNACLHRSLVDPEGNVVLKKDGSEYGSFEDIISKISIDDEKDFNAFMVALHSLDRKKADKLLLNRDIDVDSAIKDVLSKHPEWLDVAIELEEWYTQFMQTWLVDTKLLEQSAFNHMRAMYPFYVPGFRTGMERGNGSTGPGNTMGNAVGKATGGTQNIYNPIMGFVEYMQKYVTNYKTIEAMRAFYDAVLTTPGLESIAERTQADVEHVNRKPANEAALEAVKAAIDKIRRNSAGMVDGPAETAILDAVESLSPDGWIYKDTASGNDVLNIPLASGKMGRLVVYNKPILNALLKQTTIKRSAITRALGTVTRFLSANATGRNPMFAMQNFAGDTQTAMVTGNAKYQGKGKNAVTDFLSGTWLGFIPMQIAGTGDYLVNVIRDATGKSTSEAYRQFQIFGKLGYSHSSREGKTQREMRRSLYGKGKQLNAANVKHAMGKIAYAPIAAIESFAGFFEDATRYTQYKNSGTGENYGERLSQGKVARESTVDFSKQGEWGEDNAFIKAIIPFFGATIQGIDKTLSTFGKENEGKRVQIATRLVVNGIMTQLVIGALRNATWDDEEKEAYDRMSVYEKNKYHHIKLPSGKFIRIKRSQDALIQYADAIGTVLGNALTGYEGDAWGDLVAFSKEIAGNMALSFDTVFDPFNDARNNVTYYGSDIDDYSMRKLTTTERFKADTPIAYRALSAALTMAGIDLSPQQTEYVIGQFTGSFGNIGSGILQLGAEENLNAKTAAEMIADYIAGKFVIDPVFTNDISSTFYDNKKNMEDMLNEVKAGHSPAMLKGDLTDEEARKAVAEGEALLKGDIDAAYDMAQDLWDEYDAILSNELMTKSEQEMAAREVREQINQVMLSANVKMADYWHKYGVGTSEQAAAQNLLEILGMDIATPTLPTDYEKLLQTFLDDEDQPYMQMAKSVYEATGKASSIPHPNEKFTSGGVEYEIGDADWSRWTDEYKRGYKSYLERNARGFDNMTSDEQLKVMTKAHDAGHEASKKWYTSAYGIRTKK